VARVSLALAHQTATLTPVGLYPNRFILIHAVSAREKDNDNTNKNRIV